MSGRLAGRVAIVTGAARGLGEAIASRFVDEGAVVVVADKDIDAASATAAALGAHAVAVDVAERASVQSLVDTVIADHGRVDILVANAGVAGGAPFLDLTDERFDAIIAVNLRGVFLCNQIVGRRLVAQGTGGAIVNITSIIGQRANPNTAAYAASKAGVISLTHSAAAALGAHGVRVNAIGPGYMATQMTAGLRDDDSLARTVVDATVLGRFGAPHEVADAAVYLASDDASYVTGQVLYVDGGWLLHRNPQGEAMQAATVAGLDLPSSDIRT